MWVRILKSYNQGINSYIKDELIDRPESQIKLLPADTWEPALAPFDAGVDQAARAREQAQQKFLRLQQEYILAADKLRTAVGIAADRKQSLYVTQNVLEKLFTAQANCQARIKKLKSNITNKGHAALATQTALLEQTTREVAITHLMVAKLAGMTQAAEAEVDLQSISAEEARLAADQAKQELTKYDEQTKQDAPVSEAQSAPADDSAPADSGPEDADNT